MTNLARAKLKCSWFFRESATIFTNFIVISYEFHPPTFSCPWVFLAVIGDWFESDLFSRHYFHFCLHRFILKCSRLSRQPEMKHRMIFVKNFTFSNLQKFLLAISIDGVLGMYYLGGKSRTLQALYNLMSNSQRPDFRVTQSYSVS